MLILGFRENLNNYKFKFSNRFEYRSYHSGLDHFRYRQQLTFTFPSLTSWRMQFYTSEETFHKLNGVGFPPARWSGGLTGIQKEYFQLKFTTGWKI